MKGLFGTPNQSPYVKDAINNYIVHGKNEAVNPENNGTKASANYPLIIEPGRSAIVRLRLKCNPSEAFQPFGDKFEEIFAAPHEGC